METPYFTEYKYDAFGNQVSNYLLAVNNPYQYNGKYFDFETGFYYLNARYYNTEVGRFMQEDTYHGQIKNASTLNLYNYCGSNPIAYEDGTGHFWETAFDIAGLAWSVYDFAKKPNLWNGLCVAWDVIALVAPCIPGSYVAKGAKLLYKGAKYVVKTSKSSKRANKLIKTLDKAHDTYKAYKKSKNSYKIYESAAESYKRKKQIAKANTEKNVKSLVNSAKNSAAAKAKKFTQESAEQVSKKTSSVLSQGTRTTYVYFGMNNNKETYVGISINVAKRKMQHGNRFDRLEPITTPLTRKEARSIEQVLIEQNPQFTNKINSISKNREWYEEAIEWGTEWIENNLN